MKNESLFSHQKFLQLGTDHKQSARAANLAYVTDSKPGIIRTKKGKRYVYTYQGKILKNKIDLERIRKLAIPPSWTNVWICPTANGHIQATGTDLNGRKQYRYHVQWNALRNETKFHRLYEFGKALPHLRKQLKKDMASTGLTQEKVLATVINLMEHTYIRIGNDGYEKLYGSYGLTTLKDKHVTIGKEKMLFCFTGKKGIEHSITIKNKRLARIIKQCKDVPGKELFQYYDTEGTKKNIDSGSVNSYIKQAAGMEITAKDFRTWAGSLQALESFRAMNKTGTEKDIKKNIVQVLDTVSSKLGNSRNVCKKYYVHPGLIKLYEEDKLKDHLKTTTAKKIPDATGLSVEEKILMSILKHCSSLKN